MAQVEWIKRPLGFNPKPGSSKCSSKTARCPAWANTGEKIGERRAYGAKGKRIKTTRHKQR
jgi:hypothetical protein